MLKKVNTFTTWGIIFLVAILVVQFLKNKPIFIDTTYEKYNGFYRAGLTYLTASIPFSLGDILYTIVVLFLMYNIIHIYKKKKTWKERGVQWATMTLQFITIFYIYFNLSWGLNYYKTPLAVKLGIGYGYSEEDLLSLTGKIIEETNALQLSIQKDSLLPVTIDSTREELYAEVSKAMEVTSEYIPTLYAPFSSIKNTMFSLPLTYMGFAGYINPFTLEAQINTKIPKLTMPITVAHEIAHQRGFASESEANFIGYMMAKKHKTSKYQYAANIYALRYCLSTLNKNESIAFDKLLHSLSPAVLENLRENEIFWKSYKTSIDSLFKNFYGNFLKMNNQKEGILSYNRFIDLLINYDKLHQLYKDIE